MPTERSDLPVQYVLVILVADGFRMCLPLSQNLR